MTRSQTNPYSVCPPRLLPPPPPAHPKVALRQPRIAALIASFVRCFLGRLIASRGPFSAFMPLSSSFVRIGYAFPTRGAIRGAPLCGDSTWESGVLLSVRVGFPRSWGSCLMLSQSS